MSSETDQEPDSQVETRSRKTRDQHQVWLDGGKALAADTAACVRFFSRLPLPAVNTEDNPMSPPDFVRIARAAPLAGAIIALPQPASVLRSVSLNCRFWPLRFS